MFIGIDVGKTGAIAFLDRMGQFLRLDDMPMKAVKFVPGGKDQWILDVDKLAELFEIVDSGDCVIVEALQPNPKNGCISAFGTGRLFGAVEAMLNGCNRRHMDLNPLEPDLSNLDVQYVYPQAWKKQMGLIGEKKRASLVLARELFPEAAPWLKLQENHDRAEALLIAYYGYMLEKEDHEVDSNYRDAYKL